MLLARPVVGDENLRANSDPSPWLMFHHDENHTGVATGGGNIDPATGRQEWSRQLGPRTIGTPSIGDLDGDGTTEIVVCSYDGRVYALGGPRAGQAGDDPAVWEPASSSPSDGARDCDQYQTPGCSGE